MDIFGCLLWLGFLYRFLNLCDDVPSPLLRHQHPFHLCPSSFWPSWGLPEGSKSLVKSKHVSLCACVSAFALVSVTVIQLSKSDYLQYDSTFNLQTMQDPRRALRSQEVSSCLHPRLIGLRQPASTGQHNCLTVYMYALRYLCDIVLYGFMTLFLYFSEFLKALFAVQARTGCN